MEFDDDFLEEFEWEMTEGRRHEGGVGIGREWGDGVDIRRDHSYYGRSSNLPVRASN